LDVCAQSDRELGLPGEDLAGVSSARSFVGWYNGLAQHRDDSFGEILASEAAREVVIIGQGNVAIDCARVLCKTVDELRTTDIASHALEALAASRVERVSVVGRRGHVQAAFTMKELREVTRLAATACVVDPAELARGRTPSSLAEIEAQRARRRADDLLGKVARGEAGRPADWKDGDRELRLRFLLNPVAFEAAAGDQARVGAVRCQPTRLEGDAGAQRAVPDADQEPVALPAGLVLRSIGYRSVPIPGAPFDDAKGTLRQKGGRCLGDAGDAVPGLYCAGWVKRGPTGIIGTNIPDAKETVRAVVQDWAQRGLGDAQADPAAAVAAAAAARGVSVVSWDGWQRIDAAERARGSPHGKPREKYARIDEMLEAAAAQG